MYPAAPASLIRWVSFIVGYFTFDSEEAARLSVCGREDLAWRDDLRVVRV